MIIAGRAIGILGGCRLQVKIKGREYTVDLDWGSFFSDGRGSIFLAATYDEQKGIDWDERDRAR